MNGNGREQCERNFLGIVNATFIHCEHWPTTCSGEINLVSDRTPLGVRIVLQYTAYLHIRNYIEVKRMFLRFYVWPEIVLPSTVLYSPLAKKYIYNLL